MQNITKFDVDSVDYIDNVTEFIKSLPTFDEELSTDETNPNFIQATIKDMTLADIECMLVGDGKVVFRLYNGELHYLPWTTCEVGEHTSEHHSLAVCVFDKMFWIYAEELLNSVFPVGTLEGFGFDMTMPFLETLTITNIVNND